MDRFEELAVKYGGTADHVAQAVGEPAREEFRQFFLAAALRVWGSNGLYSDHYKTALEKVFGESWPMEQIMTALHCCSEKVRAIVIPAFFKELLEKAQEGEPGGLKRFVDLLDELLVAVALITEDFTQEESDALTEILARLRMYSMSQGIMLSAADHTARITPRNEDSYLRRVEPKQETRIVEVPKADEEPAPIPVDVTLNVKVTGLENVDKLQDLVQNKTEDTEETMPEPAKQEAPPSEQTLEELLGELDSLVGLETVKKDVHSLINFLRISKAREARGMKVPTISYHLVFTGNPGTGKTTVARLVAKLYYHMGLLPQGQLIEADRSTLVAGYLGQTAIKTQKVIQRALGGVLFIDEAYSLAGETDDSYGREAIETILKAMEDYRDELVVIVAGYDELMHKFINSNPGLASRFNKYFHFPDYTGEEMLSIFKRFCTTNGYDIEAETADALQGHFRTLYANREEHFGNARTVRNLFEKSIHNQADRLAQNAEFTDRDLELITMADIPAVNEEVPYE